MYFTKEPLRKYERMMQGKPKHERDPAKTMLDRDCKHCLHFDKQREKCSKKKCVIFDD
jgi:hypothetical protein